jgi:L-fuconate dehydratase
LRWLGPEKGVMHMAISAVINALWDLKAKRAGLPLWRLLSAMSPEELVSLIDFRYLTDAITPQEAMDILRGARDGCAERERQLLEYGYPAYTTMPGWSGYGDDKLRRLCEQAVADGFDQIKLKVGADLGEDLRRLRIAREACGPDIRIAVDANQRWDVASAIDWIRELAPFKPWWVEEPTSPDDVVGLCELVQHLAMFDYVAVSGSMDDRVIEYVDHLHAHFVDRVRISGGRYLAPRAPGFGSTIKPASLAPYAYPDGPTWRTVP